MKVVTIIGARPQFIKAAAVSHILRENNEEVLVHTGQHYDENMSDIFFEELNIPIPNYNLNVGSGSHGYQTGNMLIEIEKILINEKPDCVLVYGDTNSTLAGALAASKLLIPVAHIEAGLRSFNKNMPEEQNRILTDHLSSYLFAPTKTAVFNLKNEGIVTNVNFTGDVMFDAVIHFKEIAKARSNVLEKYYLKNQPYILSTIHRAENTNNIDRLQNIISAFNTVKQRIILPLHPRTLKYVQQYDIKFGENIVVIEPLGYLDMLMLEQNCTKIVTDSGGIQKEAYFLDKPCITLRDETEWVETVLDGRNIITGADKNKIVDAILNFAPTKPKGNYFGNGNSASEILKVLNDIC